MQDYIPSLRAGVLQLPCSGLLFKTKVTQHLSLALRCACSGTHLEVLLNCSFILQVLPQREGCDKQLFSVVLTSRGWAVCFAPRSHPFSLFLLFPLFLLSTSSSKPNLGVQCEGPRPREKEEVLSESVWPLHVTHSVPCLGALPSIKAGGMAVQLWRDLLWQRTFLSAVKHEAGWAGMYFPLRQSGRGEGACKEEIQLFQSTSALCAVGAREGRTDAEREIQEKRRENRVGQRKATNGEEKLFICAQMSFKNLFS